MKKLFFLPFIILGFMANAKNYYISNSGNDANDGTSPASAWATLNKLNSFTALDSGDSVLFKRGDTFYGQFSISKSGTSFNPIVFSAYGTGAKPIITGFTTASKWTNLGGNIWESATAISTLSTCNMVTINGVNSPMGRYPNTGFLTYKSHSSNTRFTDPVGLTGSPNWTGAEFAFFINTYVVNRSPITAQSGSTITITPADGNRVQRDGLRYIIQNDPRTLDTTNEWYYNPSTNKLRIYSTGSPTNVQLATIDTAVYLNGISYVTFNGLLFTGQNRIAVEIRNSKYISVTNCDFTKEGLDAIDGPYWGNSTGLRVSNCTFNDINNNAIRVNGDHDHAYIGNNIISNVGQVMGVGRSSDGNSVGIFTHGKASKIEYNNITNVGYVGIYFANDSTKVNNNFISNILSLKTDGGGIYTSNGNTGRYDVGRKVYNNIVINSPNARALYIDDGSSGVEVFGNTLANCEYGIYIHGSKDINIHDNIIYNNSASQLLFVAESYLGETIRRVNMFNNIVVSKEASQLIMLFGSPYDDIAQFGLADNNYYGRPIDDNLTFACNATVSGSRVYTTYTLAGWKAYTGQDANSLKSPKTITDINNLRLEYNATSSNKNIPLEGKYIDVKGNHYDKAITLLPYTSVILIK